MSTKAVVYTGLGGSRRLESGEYDADLTDAYFAGRDARIAGKSLQGALKDIPGYRRGSWMRGYKSICK